MTEYLIQADMIWDDLWKGSCVGGGRPAPACIRPSGPQPRSADAPLSSQVVGTDAGAQEEAGRVIRQPAQKLTRNFFFFFFSYILFFFVYIYLYISIIAEHKHIYI